MLEPQFSKSEEKAEAEVQKFNEAVSAKVSSATNAISPASPVSPVSPVSSSVVPSIALSLSPVIPDEDSHSIVVDPLGITKRLDFVQKLEEMHQRASESTRREIAAQER